MTESNVEDKPRSLAAKPASRGRIAVVARVFLIFGALVLVGGAIWALGPWGDDAESGQVEGDGTYQVPDNIEPGLYRTQGGPDCHWQRLGSNNHVLAEQDETGPKVVGIKSSDKAFRTRGCGEWKLIHRSD